MYYRSLILAVFLVSNFAILLCFGQNFTYVNVGNEITFGVSNFQLPYDEAVQSCKANNMTILQVNSEGKDRLLVDLFVNGQSNVTLPASQSWIDGKEISREGVWQSVVTNHPLYYTRWFSDQPDDAENLSCAFQHTGSLLYWRDGNCSASFYFICERYVVDVNVGLFVTK